MKRNTVIAGAAAAVVLVVWAASTVTIRSAGEDGFMVLYGHQARECADGGGCSIWSKREVLMVIQAAMRALNDGAGHQKRQEPNV
jgi:hypothetical protein